MKFPVLINANKPYSLLNAIYEAKKYIKENHSEKNVMFCPYCGKPLKATERKERLETLCEHVSCAEPTLKTVYKCDCNASICTMWGPDGGAYNDFPNGISKEEFHLLYKLQKEIDKAYLWKWPNDALNSYSYKSECEFYGPTSRKEYKLKFFKNQKYVPVIKANYIYDEFGTQKFVDFTIEYREYTEDNCYRLWNCWFYQISHNIKMTKLAYKSWLSSPDEIHLKRLFGRADMFRDNIELDEYKGFEKIYYKHIIPLFFGKILGIKYNEE